MKKTLILSFLALAAMAQAADDGIPLAVTTLAHPSLKTTPTAAELAASDRYLASGLKLLERREPRLAQRAVEELKDSVRIAPRAENYKALGTAYYEAGDQLKAAWAYRQSLQLRPDAKVQALVDSLEGKDHPEDRFNDKNDELRYQRLVEAAKAAEKAGQRDTALRDYADAYAVHNGPEARRPALRLAADLADDYLEANAVEQAIRTMARVQGLRAGVKDAGADELAALKRLNKAEDKVVKLTGERMREHQKAMLSDEEQWQRSLAEKIAGKVKDVNVNVKAAEGGR